jgi:O-antigen/teichoic acid export membrane protein
LRKLLKILGILFSIATVVFAISIFIEDGYKDQSRLAWMMVTLCGSLIFNGGTAYLTKKDKKDCAQEKPES